MLTVIDIINRVLGYFNVADKPKGKPSRGWHSLPTSIYYMWRFKTCAIRTFAFAAHCLCLHLLSFCILLA